MKKLSIVILILLLLGVGLCIAAFFMGVSGLPSNMFHGILNFTIGSTEGKNMQTQYLTGVDDITRLELDVDDANCTIQYGEDWELSSTDNDAEWQVEGHTLTIEQHEERHWIHSSVETLVLTVPEGIQLDSMDMDVEAGAVNLSDFVVNGTILCDLEAGEIVMDNMTAEGLKLDVEAGDITFDGVTTGDIQVDCSMGSITMDLQNGSTIGYVDSKVDLGDFGLYVNNQSMMQGNGISRNLSTEVPNTTGNDKLTISCDVGSITVNLYTNAA